ncbi:unnamed protein product [Amoebophrya sp. A25]|nr:unnamed protein product [Amoebophrya sp. A25]|eukprot:GSA25T00027229001.1
MTSTPSREHSDLLRRIVVYEDGRTEAACTDGSALILGRSGGLSYFRPAGERRRLLLQGATSEIRPKVAQLVRRANTLLPRPLIFNAGDAVAVHTGKWDERAASRGEDGCGFSAQHQDLSATSANLNTSSCSILGMNQTSMIHDSSCFPLDNTTSHNMTGVGGSFIAGGSSSSSSSMMTSPQKKQPSTAEEINRQEIRQHYTKRQHARWRVEDCRLEDASSEPPSSSSTTEKCVTLTCIDGDCTIRLPMHARFVHISWPCLIPDHRAVRTTTGANRGTTIAIVYEHVVMRQTFPLRSVPPQWRYPVAVCLTKCAQDRGEGVATTAWTDAEVSEYACRVSANEVATKLPLAAELDGEATWTNDSSSPASGVLIGAPSGENRVIAVWENKIDHRNKIDDRGSCSSRSTVTTWAIPPVEAAASTWSSFSSLQQHQHGLTNSTAGSYAYGGSSSSSGPSARRLSPTRSSEQHPLLLSWPSDGTVLESTSRGTYWRHIGSMGEVLRNLLPTSDGDADFLENILRWFGGVELLCVPRRAMRGARAGGGSPSPTSAKASVSAAEGLRLRSEVSAEGTGRFAAFLCADGSTLIRAKFVDGTRIEYTQGNDSFVVFSAARREVRTFAEPTDAKEHVKACRVFERQMADKEERSRRNSGEVVQLDDQHLQGGNSTFDPTDPLQRSSLLNASSSSHILDPQQQHRSLLLTGISPYQKKSRRAEETQAREARALAEREMIRIRAKQMADSLHAVTAVGGSFPPPAPSASGGTTSTGFNSSSSSAARTPPLTTSIGTMRSGNVPNIAASRGIGTTSVGAQHDYLRTRPAPATLDTTGVTSTSSSMLVDDVLELQRRNAAALQTYFGDSLRAEQPRGGILGATDLNITALGALERSRKMLSSLESDMKIFGEGGGTTPSSIQKTTTCK